MDHKAPENDPPRFSDSGYALGSANCVRASMTFWLRENAGHSLCRVSFDQVNHSRLYPLAYCLRNYLVIDERGGGLAGAP